MEEPIRSDKAAREQRPFARFRVLGPAVILATFIPTGILFDVEPLLYLVFFLTPPVFIYTPVTLIRHWNSVGFALCELLFALLALFILGGYFLFGLVSIGAGLEVGRHGLP